MTAVGTGIHRTQRWIREDNRRRAGKFPERDQMLKHTQSALDQITKDDRYSRKFMEQELDYLKRMYRLIETDADFDAQFSDTPYGMEFAKRNQSLKAHVLALIKDIILNIENESRTTQERLVLHRRLSDFLGRKRHFWERD